MKPLKRIVLLGSLMFLALACDLSALSPRTAPVPPTQASAAPTGTSTLSPTHTAQPPSATLPPSPSPALPYNPNALGPQDFPPNVDPLTGLLVDDPAQLDHRPVAIKVSNYPRSNRPQWGLSLADLVFEYYHNNDLTRFHAIFYGQGVGMVGPIRSARPFDDYLISIYKSNFVSASADSRIRSRLLSQEYAARLIFLLEGACPPRPVCRYLPDSYDYLIASTTAVGDYLSARGVDDVRQPLDGMSFSVKPPSGGEDASRLYLRYSYAAYLYWDYDPGSGRYLRYQDTQEDVQGRGEAYALLTDRLNGQPIAADNVVVLLVSHFYQVYQPPTNGKPAVEIVDMRFTGSGVAYAFRDGRTYQLTWVRPTDDSVLYLVDSAGTRYPFKPGTTWFEVLGLNSSLEASDGVWRFQFVLQ